MHEKTDGATDTIGNIRLAGVELESVVDGPGIRAAIFTQGCSHRCEGCHNPKTHDPSGGQLYDIDDIARRVTANPRLTGVTLTGGEPLEQAPAVDALIDRIRLLCPQFDFMLYTGYTWEWIMASGDAAQRSIVSKMKIVVDGRFVLAQRNLELRFRGSENQRVLDAQASLREGRPVLWQFETYFGLE